MTDQGYSDEPEGSRPKYLPPEEIAPMALSDALTRLALFEEDHFLRMQVHNLELVDGFLMDLEYKILAEWFETERTPPDTHFLLAQSQMWIFAAYELLRTWHQRAREILKWAGSGGLEQKLKALKEANDGRVHFGRDVRIAQLERVIQQRDLVDTIRTQVALLHIPYTRLEYLRVSLAKHEVSGREKSAALMPGYGRLDMNCGSLNFDVGNDSYSTGPISRRDIADELRAINVDESPPSADYLKQFDDFMAGR